MHGPGFAIGNGLSRVNFDLGKLDGNGLTVGCNRLYHDYTPDVLVTLDHRMSEEIRALDPRPFKWLHIEGLDLMLDDKVLMDFRDLNIFSACDSGMLAVSYLAKVAKCDPIYMLGYDFYRPFGRKNDVYHDEPVTTSVPFENWWILRGYARLILVGSRQDGFESMRYEDFEDLL